MSNPSSGLEVAPQRQGELPERIWILDDSPTDRELLRRQLLRLGAAVAAVREFDEAPRLFDALRTSSADLLLLDYDLGSTDGVNVLRRLRQSENDLPVVMLTGFGDERLAATAMRAGADDYLPKDQLSRSALGKAVAQAIEHRRLRTEARSRTHALETANRELGQRNEEIGRFYHTLSHELRSPLAATREFVSIVLDGIAGPINEEQKRFLGIALHGCDRLDRHVQDLLDSTRLDAGKLRLDLERFDLAEVLEEEALAHRSQAEEAGLEFRFEIESGLPPAWGDPKRIHQVVANLLGNAIKFTDGGSVSLCAHRYPGGTRICVKDTGCGIPSEDLPSVCHRLYQVPEAQDGNRKGLGLGLHISRQLLILHGTDLEIESEVGKGSSFAFRLAGAPGDEEAPR